MLKNHKNPEETRRIQKIFQNSRNNGKQEERNFIKKMKHFKRVKTDS